jgi:hypothetical protein
MKSAQEFIHWIEVGGGARWIRLAALLAGGLALSLVVAWKQFHGPSSETTLVQADVGRQLARGNGFTTLVNYGQTTAVLQSRGVRFDPARPNPELHHAPLYPLVIAAGLRLLPDAQRDKLFADPPTPPDGFRADYFLLGINLLLLWLAAWLTFTLGRKLFEPRVGLVAALALLLSVSIWQQTVAVNGTPLLMVLVLLTFHAWHRLDAAAEASGRTSAPISWSLLFGVLCGAMFLTEYSAGVIVLVAIAYATTRFTGRAKITLIVSLVAGFLIVSAPWMARNIGLTGHPVALAAQNVALKAGDSTAEPANVIATMSAELPRIDLKKLANKTLTSLQENLQTRWWSGAMWFAAFFVVGWLYAFRAPVTNRLRWVATIAFGVLLLAQAAFNSGATERHVALWFAPLILIFGAGFFFVLTSSSPSLAQWPRVAATALLALQALPLLHDALEPRRLHFHYPPYFPGLFQGLRKDLEARESIGRFGIMTDVPAGMAWYGQSRAWMPPPTLRDFYAITLEQPIGQLLLTPRILDRPFFSQLNARSVLPGMLGAIPNRFGEWGEIYAGLLTGALPREFPLGPPQKLSENLFLLQNPALPPPRGK